MKSLYLAVSAVAGLVLVPLAVACGSDDPAKNTSEGPVGEVEMAVSAVGPDGATYSLPVGTQIVLQPSGGGFTCRPVTTNSPTQTLSIPAGTYVFALSTTCSAAALGSDAGSSPVAFTLARAADGGASSVASKLQNPVQSVTVTQGGVSNVVFNFVIQNLGTITMSTGSAVVSMTADASTTSAPTSGSVAGSFGPTGLMDYTSGALPGLVSLFSAPATANFAVTMSNLSAFTPTTNDTACATFTPQISITGASDAYTALAQEYNASGATARICFADATVPSASFSIGVYRTGTPVSPTFSSVLAGGSADGGAPDGGSSVTAEFDFYVSGYAPSYVYNGSTIALGLFATPMTMTSGLVQAVITSYIPGTPEIMVTGPGSVTVSVRP